MTGELLSATPDHEQIIKGIVDINADLPASSTLDFTTSHLPSMTQKNSFHHRVIPLSQISPHETHPNQTTETFCENNVLGHCQSANETFKVNKRIFRLFPVD